MGSKPATHPEPWLDTGAHKLPITIEHRPATGAGSFTGGGAKTLWHTAEGTDVDGVIRTLVSAGDEVHFVFDPHAGRAVQMLPFNVTGKGLVHNGTATNSANVIQIELATFSDLATAKRYGSTNCVQNFGDAEYRHLAALALAIERHHGTPRKVRNFTRPVRFAGQAFIDFAGHCGHCHAPENVHTDPGTHFQGQRLMDAIAELDR